MWEEVAPYLLEKRKLPPTHLRRLDNASETQIAAAVQDLIQPGLEFLWIFYIGYFSKQIMSTPF